MIDSINVLTSAEVSSSEAELQLFLSAHWYGSFLPKLAAVGSANKNITKFLK